MVNVFTLGSQKDVGGGLWGMDLSHFVIIHGEFQNQLNPTIFALLSLTNHNFHLVVSFLWFTRSWWNQRKHDGVPIKSTRGEAMVKPPIQLTEEHHQPEPPPKLAAHPSHLAWRFSDVP